MPDVSIDTVGAGDLEVFFSRNYGRWVVRSRDLAETTAHEHSNIMQAIKLAADMFAKVYGKPGAVFWGEWWSEKTKRTYPACFVTREVLEFVRLHNVPDCWYVRDVLDGYLSLLAEREAADGSAPAAPAEVAPDMEIRPPDAEPAGLFDAVQQPADLAPSWEINAWIEGLTTRAGLPLYMSQDLMRWNKARCDAAFEELYRTGGTWGAAEAIYSTRGPG